MSRNLRIVSTHDFFGSFAVVPTSYGALAGGEGLRNTVNELRKGQPTLWADSGDFSQGGPLTPLTSGKSGLEAAAELGIDIAAVGNHDLDFGIPFLQAGAEKLGFPLLCANADVALPATKILSTSAGPVGFIGLTHPDLDAMSPYSLKPERPMPRQQDEIAEMVRSSAAELRSAGALAVIAIVHNGIEWRYGERGMMVDDTQFESWSAGWRDDVDLIVAGHSLGHHIGRIGKTPFLQPWPFGSEVAICDIDLSIPNDVRMSSVMAKPGRQWTGHGSDLIAAAEQDIVGRLDEALEARAHIPSLLANMLSKAVLTASESDMAFANVACGQPCIDGRFAYLAAGHVTRLQILQMMPWTDHQLVYAEIGGEELATLQRALSHRRAGRSTDWGSARRLQFGKPDTIKIATTSGYPAHLLSQLVGRPLEWTPKGRTALEGLRQILN
jgi:2',3'-cyclic-nucleotide 2'-phosphodiesterase (5'-nucleotidase family)